MLRTMYILCIATASIWHEFGRYDRLFYTLITIQGNFRPFSLFINELAMKKVTDFLN